MSLLTASEITSYTGDLYSHFLTFRKPILIYKEFTETYSSINNNEIIAGYGNESFSNNVTYTIVTGLYSGIKVGPDKLNSEALNSIQTYKNKENSYIKVEKDCKDFIERGNTKYLLIDEVAYNIVSSAKVKDYLGLKFYCFDIEQTK